MCACVGAILYIHYTRPVKLDPRIPHAWPTKIEREPTPRPGVPPTPEEARGIMSRYIYPFIPLADLFDLEHCF